MSASNFGSGPRERARDSARDNLTADPYTTERARLLARIERAQSPRPDLPTLEELLVEVTGLHPLPAAASQLIQIDDGGQFSAHDLATIIASDQILTARLLRLANSAFYGSSQRIGTVRDAVVLLGSRSVKQVALAGCFIGTGPPTVHLQYDEFWQFSVATGLLAEMLARGIGQHQGHAFTAGVLHNIGLLALDQRSPHVLAEVLARAEDQQETRRQAEHSLLGFTDADLGAALATHWNLPTELVQAIRLHAALDEPPPPDSLTALVIRARIYAQTYGLTEGIASTPSEQPKQLGDELTPSAPSIEAAFAAGFERAGGMDRLLERVDSFLQATLV